MRPLATTLLICLLIACGSDESTSAGGEGGRGGGGDDLARPARPGGPLANAGPDQRVLEGLPVHLDGRASTAGEESLPLRFRWTQEAGPRVALDDPASPEPWFVAPPARTRDGSRLVFLLTVDDGRRASRDRVVVELVRSPEAMLPAPVALAGPDLEVRPGDRVDLSQGGSLPFTLDAACLDLGGTGGCESAPLPYRFTQVEGPAVELEEAAFTAPDRPAVLTFRLDAHRGGAGAAASDCGPEGSLDGKAFCSAPDHVRVVVRPFLRNAVAPVARLAPATGLPQEGGLARLVAGAGDFEVVGTVRHPEPAAEVHVRTFRPILEGLPGGPLSRDTQVVGLSHRRQLPGGGTAKGWPRTVAVALEGRSARLSSAPVPAAVRWEPDPAAPPPVADAGDSPCLAGQACLPFLGGDRVTLDGSASTHPGGDGAASTYCWEQTFGPPVTFLEGASCLVGEPRRTFVAPEAPAGRSMHLAFVLTVDDGGPLIGRPDTAIVHVRPAGNEPPEVVLDAPAEVDEGQMVHLDASASRDPEGGPLTFRWDTSLPVALLQQGSCPQEDACRAFQAPSVTRDTPLRIELTAWDEEQLAATRTVELLVRNSSNEPPVVDAGAPLAVSPGRQVELSGSAHDPNPGDDEGLVYRWSVVEGDVTLESGEGPVARFTAPAVAADEDLVLELTVEDEHGARASDTTIVSVLAAGPWVSPLGDDRNHGSRNAPVASLRRALAVAAVEGFGAIHLDRGSWFDEGARLEIEGIGIRGGFDAEAGWTRPGDVESRLVLSAGIELGAGAGLERLVVEADAAPEVILVRGDATLRQVVVEGGALGRGAAAVHVEQGRLEMLGGLLRGPAAAADGAGLRCTGAATVDLRDAAVDGGAGPGDHRGVVLAGGCGGILRRMEITGGQGGGTVIGLDASDAAGPLLVEESIVTGGTAASAIGARLVTGHLWRSDLFGGDGSERLGLEVLPGCGGAPCAQVEGGTIRGGGGSAGGVAVGLLARGEVELAAVEAVVGGTPAAAATGIRIADGATVAVDGALRIEGGEAGLSSVGVEVLPGGQLHLVNALVFAGGGKEAHALANAGSVDLHSSLLRIHPASGGESASALLCLGGAAILRNVILDAGGSAPDRAHLRLQGAAPPQVLDRVLFAADPACGGEAGYVRGAGGGAICSAGAIAAIAPGWEALVGDPLFTDEAAGDFSLSGASPAVDAGTSEGAPALDVVGAPRGGDGDGDGQGGWDIGPRERQVP